MRTYPIAAGTTLGFVETSIKHIHVLLRYTTREYFTEILQLCEKRDNTTKFGVK